MNGDNPISKSISFLLHPERRNFLIYTLGALFLKGVSFFLIPLYTNLLSTAEFGNYDLLRNFASVTEIILSLGLLQLIYVEYFDKNNVSKTRFISTFLSIYLVISTLLYLVLGVAVFFYGAFFLPGIKYSLVLIVLITTYLNFFQVMLITVLKLSFKAVKVSVLQVVLGCTNLVLNIILVYGLKYGIDGIIVSSLVVTILSCCYGVLLFRKQLKQFSISFSFDEAKHYLAFSLPFIPNVLSFWIMNSANRWILLNYSGIEEVGIYSVAARITAIFEPLLIDPFLSAYTPVILSRFKEGNYNQDFLKRIILIPIVFAAMGFVLQRLGGLVIGEAFANSLHLVIPLSVMYAFNLIAQSSALILINRRMVNVMLLCVVAGSISCIALNFVLVPVYGAMGSVLGTLAGHIIWAALVTITAIIVLKKQKSV